MLREWLFGQRPWQERVLAFGVTLFVLALLVPLLASLVRPSAADPLWASAPPLAVGAALVALIGLLLTWRARKDPED